ncbi:MAG: hypothetical protein IT290_10990, partial [Deltaproteobacteria bacterium]|nr:hypothetical protein [Deltaproteobacteria bacterium]
LVVLLSLAGLPFVKVGDDVRLLDRRSPELAADEAAIRETIGGFDTRTVFIVSGSTVDEVLQRDEILSSTLETLQREGRIQSFQALSQFVPSASTQVRRRDALRSFLRSREEEIDAALQTLGFRSRSMEGLRDEASSTSHTNLELERFLSSTASLSVRHLWLGQVGGSYVALATVDGTNSAAQLDRLALPAGVFFSDAVAETSDILRTYRRHATLAIVGFYLLIFAFVIRRYGRIHGLLAFTPALLAALLSISMQGILAQPVNLFSVLSILIILGLGIDFTIFLLEGEDQENATMLAVILSGLSTLLSLALLAFCTSPVLQSFGHSLFFGTATAVLLSPIVLVAPRRHVQRRRRL